MVRLEAHMKQLSKLRRAKDFINAAYWQPLNLAEIAARANLSPYHFLRLYKQTFQETPHDYLTRVRVERAKTLLKTSDLSVTAICFEIGFESLGTFSSLFLREVGLPPSQYRKYARSSVYIPSRYQTLFIPSCFLSMFAPAE
jgi:AraC-like DNA-binding protein